MALTGTGFDLSCHDALILKFIQYIALCFPLLQLLKDNWQLQIHFLLQSQKLYILFQCRSFVIVYMVIRPNHEYKIIQVLYFIFQCLGKRILVSTGLSRTSSRFLAVTPLSSAKRYSIFNSSLLKLSSHMAI